MAIEYFDGFDDYSTSQLNRYYSSVGNVQISAGNGRNSSASLHGPSSNTAWLSKTFSSQATRTVGFALKSSTFANNAPFLSFWDTVGNNAQITITSVTGGLLRAFRGLETGTVLGSSSFSLNTATWYYIEVATTIHPSTGSVTINVNGVAVLTLTGQNTRNTANNFTNNIVLMSSSASASNSSLGAQAVLDIDDLYINNDGSFLGDCRVETKLPTGNGTTTNFTRGGTDSGANWSQVNDSPANDDTNYVLTGGTGNIDLYTYPALTTTAGNIQAVMTVPVARNDNAGLVSEQSVYRSGSTNYFGTTNNVSPTSYNIYPDIQSVDPNTGIAWTVSGVNNCQFGIKRTA